MEIARRAFARRGTAEMPRIVLLIETYLLAGDIHSARILADRALESTVRNGQRGVQASSLRLLGDIISADIPQDANVPEQRYREALALATELGMRPLVAHCHLGLGKLYRRTGQRQQAHEHLTSATTIYREMEMRFWLEQAEAELH
jgi:hypothetical protein